MKFIVCCPANLRFQWEIDTLLTNIRGLGDDTPIVLSLLEENPSVVEHLEGRYSNVEIHTYADWRAKKNYIPTIKPYLFWKYLEEDAAREHDDYFYIDSDIIFREMVDFSKMPLEPKVVWGSDCEGYLGYEYLETRDNGQSVLQTIAYAVGLSIDDLKNIPGAGAQLLISKPTASLMEEIYRDSQNLWDAVEVLPTNLQKWSMEMNATMYALYKHGYDIKISPELKFCWPTDSIEMWQHSKILHNSGVIGENGAGLFFKGKYVETSPFDEDLSWVRRDRCSWHYKEAIEAAKKTM